MNQAVFKGFKEVLHAPILNYHKCSLTFYYMSDTVLGDQHVLMHLTIIANLLRQVLVMAFILRMNKLRHREVEQLSPGHTPRTQVLSRVAVEAILTIYIFLPTENV
jgi:hypothetical protein